MGFIYAIHLIACVLLVVAILMQAGRGGGLTETFQSAESMFGTQTNSFMVRLTTILAAVFLSTSLFLALHSSKGNKSLMENKKLLSTVPPPAEEKPTEPKVQVKVSAPQPAAPAATAAPKEAGGNTVTNAEK